MKVLLTGKPGIGKSTILEKVKRSFIGPKFGIIGKEIRNQNRRVGFEAINHLGKRKTFAHTTDITSSNIVGGKYFVDLKVINDFVIPEIEIGINDPDSLIFIDEIGRMQALSNIFLQVVEKILNSSSNVIATIVFDPEPWSVEFKENKSIVLVEVSKKNRDLLPNLLETIFSHLSIFHKLSNAQQKLVVDLSRKYFVKEEFIQISKLFENAIPYLVNNHVGKIGSNKFKIKGNTNIHIVEKLATGFTCDCNLFNGSGQFANNQGECSHIQTVKLLEVKAV